MGPFPYDKTNPMDLLRIKSLLRSVGQTLPDEDLQAALANEVCRCAPPRPPVCPRASAQCPRGGGGGGSHAKNKCVYLQSASNFGPFPFFEERFFLCEGAGGGGGGCQDPKSPARGGTREPVLSH